MQMELKRSERQRAILELLAVQKRVSVSDLCQRFNRSEAAIRNDLAELEAESLLERIHGGALPTSRSYINLAFSERQHEMEAEKKSIARLMVSQIKDDETLMINAGTTTLFTAQELAQKQNLKVVTNSIAVAEALGELPQIKVILLGGEVNVKYYFTHGPDAVKQLQRYRADKLILSVDGVNVENGITTYYAEETDVDSAMINRADKVYVVADQSKLGRECFANIDSITSVDTLITSASAPDDVVRRIEKVGVEVLRATQAQ